MLDKKIKYDFYRQLALAYKNAAKLLKCAATIHVEASDDKLFWEKTFREIRPEDNFHFLTYTRTKNGSLATGCSTCLSYRDFLSKEFFVCIDSDYRYLLQEKNINLKHAIFQTYTYSIENHYCYSKGINKVFEYLGFENDLFDFEYFLAHYSKLLFELFLYHLHSLTKRDGIFTKDDFKLFIGIERPGLSADKMLEELQNKINPKLTEIKQIYSETELNFLKEKYCRLGMNEKNTYLYFRGHNLFDRVILPIAREVRKKLGLKYAETLSNSHKKQFFAENKDMKAYFMENIHYGEYPEIKKIAEDIQLFFENN